MTGAVVVCENVLNVIFYIILYIHTTYTVFVNEFLYIKKLYQFGVSVVRCTLIGIAVVVSQFAEISVDQTHPNHHH
jgi:hypothetical protein